MSPRPLTSALVTYFRHLSTSIPGTFPTAPPHPSPNNPYDSLLNLYLPLRHDSLLKSSSVSRYFNFDILPLFLLTFAELALGITFLLECISCITAVYLSETIRNDIGDMLILFAVVTFVCSAIYFWYFGWEFTELRRYWRSLRKDWNALGRADLMQWERKALEVAWGDKRDERRFWRWKAWEFLGLWVRLVSCLWILSGQVETVAKVINNPRYLNIIYEMLD